MESPTCPATPPLSKCPDTPPRAGSSKSSPSRWDNTPESKEKSRTPTPNRPSSPENCSICLGPLANKSFTDSCIHQFCFVCLLEWSKVKAECPLCKVAFDSIIHNVRSQDDYDKYHVVRQTVPRAPPLRSVNFHYRAISEFSEWMAQRGIGSYRTSTDNFSNTFLHEAIPVGSSRLSPYTAQSQRSSTGTSEFRRSIYQRNLWARLQPDVTGRYRDCSPEFYVHNPAQLHRLIPFLNRELNVLLNSGGRTPYVIGKILALLPQYSMTSSTFRSEVARYIGHNNAAHFCHELRAYASSPFDMVGYDRNVQYHPPGGAGYSIELDDIETSDVDAAGADDDDDDVQVIEIEEIAAATATRSHPTTSTAASTSSHLSVDLEAISRPASSSYIHRVLAPQSSAVVNVPSSSDSEDAAEDVQIVGYVKPRHERTPEVITLSSPEHSPATRTRPISPTGSQSSDDLICINLGSSSSVEHKWQDRVTAEASDDSVPTSRRPWPILRQRSSKLGRSSNNVYYESSNAEDSNCPDEEEKKSKHSKSRKMKKSARRKDKRHLKSKHPKNNVISDSDSDEGSQPSTSKGRRRKSGDDHVSPRHRDPSSSYQSSRKNGDDHVSPRRSDPSSSYQSSRKSCSISDNSSQKSTLRSAIVQNKHNSKHNASSGSEDGLPCSSSGPKIRNLVMKKTTSEGGHDSWRVASSSLSPDNYRHASSSYHSCNSPSHQRHQSSSPPKKSHSSHSGESSHSKKRKCSHSDRDSRSSHKEKHKRKHVGRSRSREMQSESPIRKVKPIFYSDESE